MTNQMPIITPPASSPGGAISAPSPGVPRLDIDPFSIAFFEDPFPFHEKLRDAGPVVWLDSWNVHAVARHAEVHAVLNDWQSYGSSRGVGVADYQKEPPPRPPSLVLESDPPFHTRVRSVYNRTLSPVAVKKLRSHFETVAEAKVDELLERRSFDAVADLTEAYPLAVFPDSLGLRREGRERLLPIADFSFNSFGPANTLRNSSMESLASHWAYVGDACKRENLSPDGFGATIYSYVDAGEISAEEASLLVRSLLIAGMDTTINGLSAAVLCLAQFPGQWDLLRKDPSLLRNAFEEAIRFETPIQSFFRTTTREVELGGHRIGEGEKIMMFLSSANRDPRKWDRPDVYDVTRKTAGHVGFGSGVHMCPGQLVARLEGEMVLSALVRKVASIEITGPVKRRYNNTLRGLGSLPVSIKPA